MSFRAIVFLGKHPSEQTSFWTNVYLGKCLSGPTTIMGKRLSGQTSFWANVVRANIYGPWADVVWADVVWADVVWANVIEPFKQSLEHDCANAVSSAKSCSVYLSNRVRDSSKYSRLSFPIYRKWLFELCRLPQQPSLTLHPLGGSTPLMWPLFLLRAKGKGKEMTGTLHVGTLKHQFLQYITIKNVFVLFHYQNNFEMNYSSAI
jgi:hypothetical protein